MPAASRFSRTASRSDRVAASPVGFFDSGVGGLCVREAFRRRLPHEDTVYIADTAHCPYGNRPAAEIVRLARRHVRMLLAHGCKMVVVACNTATAAALALQGGVTPRALDASKLVATLRAQKAFLG